MLIEQRLYDPDAANLIDEVGGLESFVRGLIGLDPSAVRKAFAEFIRNTNLNANQIEFVDMIVDALSKNGRVDPARLYEQPFTRINGQGLSGVFSPETSAEIIRILKSLNGDKAA